MGPRKIMENLRRITPENYVLGFRTLVGAMIVIVGASFSAGVFVNANSNNIQKNQEGIAGLTKLIEGNKTAIESGRAGIEDIKRMIREAGGDRWCATNMREWSNKAQALNPKWRAPSIDDLRSFPCVPGRTGFLYVPFGGPR